MRLPMRVALDHVWLSVLLAAVVPGFAHAVIQYFRGEVSIASIWVSLVAGLIAAIVLLSLKVRVQSQQLEQAQPPATMPIPTPIPATDEAAHVLSPIPSTDEAAHVLSPIPSTDEAAILAPYHLDTERRWYPYTTNDLVGKVKNLTDVELGSAIEDDIGRCMRIEGEIINVWPFDIGTEEGSNGLIKLPNAVWVQIEARSEPCNEILRASKIGETVEVIGAIKGVMQAGIIVLEVRELLPPMLRN